jgi:hypothetical protein
MDLDKINGLLQKYWNAETSLEEEQQLRTFFAREPVPESLKETASLFRYFEKQNEVRLDDPSFNKSLREKINPLTPGSGPIESKPAGQGRLFSSPFGAQGVKYVARIAAGLLVVVAATFFIREEVRKAFPDEPDDTYSDPKVAFEETKKALMMISNSFNKAQKEASKINVFNEAQEKIHGGSSPVEKEKIEDEKKTNI